MASSDKVNAGRRGWLAGLAMGVGMLLSYGTLAVQGMLFILPQQIGPKTRRLFAGSIDRFKPNTAQTFYDLQGNPILVKRGDDEFKAFNSVCPHLGCRVHWVAEDREFFCPCHRGVFNAEGVATAGPPADAGQNLFEVPLVVDRESGALYLEVPDVKERA